MTLVRSTSSEPFLRPEETFDWRDSDAVVALFVRRDSLAADDPERERIRTALIEGHLTFVRGLAARYRNRGEPMDDLLQVGMVGLVKAVDRFDAGHGVRFVTYAVPTVLGEIRRHFRDRGWAVSVPRPWQELRAAIRGGEDQLSQKLGRSPTVRELAAHLELSEEEVITGLDAAQAYSTLSLNAPLGDEPDAPTLEETLGDDDGDYDAVDYRESLRPMLNSLPPREQRILLLRFYADRSQMQIAEEIGISQMHVSRLLSRVCADLRSRLLAET